MNDRAPHELLREVLPAAVLGLRAPASDGDWENVVTGSDSRDVLTRRRSERAFAAWLPHPEELEAIAAAALASPSFGLGAVLIVPSADRVYDGRPDGLREIASAPSVLNDFVLQRELSMASVVVVIVGDFEAVLPSEGPAGYVRLYRDAGRAIARVGLKATEMRLAHCISLGLLERALQTLPGFDGYQRSALAAVFLGAPRSTDATD